MKASEARNIAEQTAREEAERDLKFSGNSAIARLPISDKDKSMLREALIFYALCGATRTVGALKLHGVFEKG